ncbi:DMT family transporter [Piscinibacter terrae]|uniref:DMT family transporter n=1 Tax=Piscinibacter terrae TaxID=2496871 RepID=A0A3N7HRY4_9BURK|nr:DMT family transporter [Albitalea terrae]RQP25010.1 DMT family transporter [Albitalea terrae]
MPHQQRPTLGIALVVLMSVCFAGMDTTVKYGGLFLPVLLMLWVRYATQALAMTAWLALSSTAGFRAAHPKFQLVRGMLLLGTSAMSFFGVQHMPVAEFTAIVMLTPVIVTMLAAWVLHERVSPLRWALVVGGFAGALIIIRPGSGLFGWAVLFPVAGTLCYASFQVLTSKLSALESPYTTHFYTGAVGAAVLTPFLLASPIDIPAVLHAASGPHLSLMLCVGLLGTFGHLLLILALGFAPTSTLMPFVYVQIVSAAFFGWVAFRHVPDAFAFVGMAVVAVCGAASAWLNVREASSRRPMSPLAADTITD